MCVAARVALLRVLSLTPVVAPHLDVWLSYLLAREGAAAFYSPQRLMSYRMHAGVRQRLTRSGGVARRHPLPGEGMLDDPTLKALRSRAQQARRRLSPARGRRNAPPRGCAVPRASIWLRRWRCGRRRGRWPGGRRRGSCPRHRRHGCKALPKARLCQAARTRPASSRWSGRMPYRAIGEPGAVGDVEQVAAPSLWLSTHSSALFLGRRQRRRPSGRARAGRAAARRTG